MEKRYRVLRIVAGFYKIIGLLIAGISILAAIFSIVAVIVGGLQLQNLSPTFQLILPLLSGGGVPGIILGIVVVLAAMLVTAALTFATGEGISVVMDIEENTRATGIMLKQIRQGSPRRADQPPAP